MDWEPEQLNLGALGFAGICRETFRVLIRAILPKNKSGWGAPILSALLLGQIFADCAFPTDHTSFLVVFAYILAKLVSYVLILFFSLVCTACYVFRVATLYCTDGDSGASDRIIRDLPRVPLWRLILVFLTVLPFAISYMCLSAIAWLELPRLDASDKVVVLALQLLGWAAFLAGAAYVDVVSHVACVVALLEEMDTEDLVGFCLGTVRKSRALLAGKLWTAAAVFVPLDGCFVALQLYFPDVVLGVASGLGRGDQVAAWAVMAVALWAVVVVTLVAQPVVYLVCKNHHNEVVDKVHLNYIGEYQRVDMDGDSGVELEAVKTEQIPDPAPASAVQSPAGTSTPT